ncbi:MAG: hypothetical protein WCC36_14275 [Gammaproteobacteria bacterium]
MEDSFTSELTWVNRLLPGQPTKKVQRLRPKRCRGRLVTTTGQTPQKDTAMVQETLYCLLALLEAVIVLAAFSGYLLIRLHRVANQAKLVLSKPRTPVPSEPQVARLDIVQYLARDTWLESLSAHQHGCVTPSAGRTSRSGSTFEPRYYNSNKEWSQQDDRSEIFWRALAGRLERLVRDHGLIPGPTALKQRQDDEPGLTDVVERQAAHHFVPEEVHP